MEELGTTKETIDQCFLEAVSVIGGIAGITGESVTESVGTATVFVTAGSTLGCWW